MSPAVDLSRVHWEPVLAALRGRWERSATPRNALHLAEASSLAALHCDDYTRASQRSREALRLDPLNPIHQLRAALCAMQFGAWAEALAVLGQLDPVSAESPRAVYLRALATLRAGELKRAANILNELIERVPTFIPARFLLAEAYLRQRLKGLEKHLLQLPRDPAWAGAWTALLATALLLYPTDGKKIVEQALAGSGPFAAARSSLGKAGPEETQLRQLLALAGLPPAELLQSLHRLPPGSRLEQLTLLLAYARIGQVDQGLSGLRELRELHELLPERGSVRRLYAAALTRQAVEAVGRDQHRVALRLIELCLRLEPHEPIHFQNRAALHTILREQHGYHASWAALERHHYRLLLLGDLTPRHAHEVARLHRMFAQQARLTTQGSDGILRLDKTDHEGAVQTALIVNQTRIESDPDLLRQWLHHLRAELWFCHVALGFDAGRALLGAADLRLAQARSRALGRLGGALGVLVPEDGPLLAERLQQRWTQLAEAVMPRYAAAPPSPEVAEVHARHLDACADLALLCLQWEPSPVSEAIVEEMIDFLEAEAPFLAGEALLASAPESAESPASARPMLKSYVRSLLKRGERSPAVLSLAEAQQVVRALESSLLQRLAIELYNAQKTPDRRKSERSLRLLDRARELNAEDELLEYRAAHLLFVSDFFTESRAALARFFQLTPPEHPLRSKAEELQRQLDELKGKDQRGAQRTDEAHYEPVASPGNRLTALEQELDRFPSSIQTYEELAHGLAQEGQYDAALQWTERAISRCLSRQGQLRARALDLELTGLKLLAVQKPQAARLFLAGSRGAALLALPPAQPTRHYAIDYLEGQCLLADKRPTEAQQAFQRALAGCTRHLHRAVLRPIAEDIERVYLEQTRRCIDRLLGERNFAAALLECKDLLAQLTQPERGLLDLARVLLAALLATLGRDGEPLALPELQVQAAWRDELLAVAALTAPLERVQRLSELAARLCPSDRSEAEVVCRKVEVLEAQLRLTSALAESSRLLQSGDLNAALALLDGLDEPSRAEPRVGRQRALLLLRLERIAEADLEAARLAKSSDPVAQEFSARYPELRFRQGIQLAAQKLRAGAAPEAHQLLTLLPVLTEAQGVERAYYLACCAALSGYQHRQRDERRAARQSLRAALTLVEQNLAAARRCDFRLLIELQEQLERDLSALEDHL